MLLQAALLAAVSLSFWWLFSNTLDNLEQRNITTGFGFLEQETGFNVNFSLIAYDESSTFGRLLLVGLANTGLVAVTGVFLATILGFTIGIMQLSQNWLISRLAAAYVETLRNLPLLLQILFWYSAMLNLLPYPKQSLDFMGLVFLNKRGLYFPAPQWADTASVVVLILFLVVGLYLIFARHDRRLRIKTGQASNIRYRILGAGVLALLICIGLTGRPVTFDLPVLRGFNFRGGASLTPEFVALLLSLVTYTAAFIAEIVRAGIQSVSKGQVEAARALGLKNLQTLRKIVIPQAMRVIIPPLTSQYLNLTKNSSLAAAIAYPELVSVFAGTALNQTGQAIEILFITMTIYLLLSLLSAALMNWYNNRVKLVER
ncbi:MAG: amino acid ABC transporter permease [Parvibaculales bacterium]